jgi:hypothetical protein
VVRFRAPVTDVSMVLGLWACFLVHALLFITAKSLPSRSARRTEIRTRSKCETALWDSARMALRSNDLLLKIL